MIGFVWAIDGDVQVGRLVLGQSGEFDAEFVKVQPGDLLVEVLGQHMHRVVVFFEMLCELDLGDHLVGEAGAHDEAWMPGCAAEVEQSSLREDQDARALGFEQELIELRLDVDAFDIRVLHQRLHLDFVVEVPDVAHDGLVLHPLHVIEGDDVLVAGGGDEDVGGFDHIFECQDFVSFHCCLQSTDRVDLGDDHPAALAFERLAAAFTHIAVPADHGDLAREHDIACAVESVDERVATAVDIVELGFGDRVVDIDRGEGELAFSCELVEAVDACGCFFGDAPDQGCVFLEPPGVGFDGSSDGCQDMLPFFGIGIGVPFGDTAGVFVFEPVNHEERGVAAVVDDLVWA